MPTVAALSTGAINRASIAVTVDAYAIPRTTVVGNDNGDRTRMKTPRCHACCEERSSSHANAPNGVAVATSIYLSPSASRPPPHEPCRTSSARLMLNPRRSRACHAAPAPRQALAQAGCRVTPTSRGSVVSSVARPLRVFHSLPAGSFNSIRHQRPFVTRRLVTPSA